MSQGDTIWRLLEVSGIEEVQGSGEGARVYEAQAALHCGFHCELHSLTHSLTQLFGEAWATLGSHPSSR